MADFVFNIAKGRVGELVWRVKNNDPSTSGLVVAVLAVTGLETDAVLKDKDTLSAVLAGTTNEPTNTGYVRKVLTDVDLDAVAPDDANDWLATDIPDQVWLEVLAGTNWAKLVIGYDPDTTGGADTAIIPMTCQDFAIEPDGTDVLAQINAGGFFRAQEPA
ncbi:hypothetical protein [Herbidospora mongoliensis]|uniref:hypothetical protein n=1 Tax=Herbidospora mongoliensis TaxID=688067 RepID=UPI0008319515|nr:hypothetical protein [Herbidospora mongoliensis]